MAKYQNEHSKERGSHVFRDLDDALLQEVGVFLPRETPSIPG